MGVDIALFRIDQKGTSSRHRKYERIGVYYDRGDRFARACEATSLPMLSRVDPVGSLVLTPAEMDQLVAELTELASVSGSPGFLTEILDLAAKCASDPATELHLDGD